MVAAHRCIVTRQNAEVFKGGSIVAFVNKKDSKQLVNKLQKNMYSKKRFFESKQTAVCFYAINLLTSRASRLPNRGAPEVADVYLRWKIGPKVDIFALGAQRVLFRQVFQQKCLAVQRPWVFGVCKCLDFSLQQR